MKRPCTSPARLFAAALLCLVLAAPALANDFYQRPPVPSSRDQTKTTTTTRQKKTSTSLGNAKLTNKIVKSTKTGNTGGESSRPKGSLQ